MAARNIFGFNDQKVAQDLHNFVTSGAINKIPQDSVELPQPGIPASRIWMATPKTTITAATGGAAGTTYVVGSGEIYLLDLRVSDLKLLKSEAVAGGTWRSVPVYNLYDNSIPVSTTIVFPVIQDRKGKFWISSPVVFKPHCRFVLTSTLTETSSSATGNISVQWGQGISHPTTTGVTLENPASDVGGEYMFDGPSGRMGVADYKNGTTWVINNMRCP